MVSITINDQTIQVPAGKTIIQAAHEAGIRIPYYCYHPGLVPDGNCRMCLVEVEKAPKLMVACKTPISDGMVVRTDTDKVTLAQRDVMEIMLVNHPIDCPVCDQAGECKLQDYYFEHELRNSNFKERKGHFPKAQQLGPHVKFDGERCIQCSRCVRFLRDVTETCELGLLNRGDRTQISLAAGVTLDNPYSMNVVDICPVGALTSADFRFRKRVWFMDEQASTCPGCATGCSVNYDFVKAENMIYRVRAGKDLNVNGYWMCDDGRFLHEQGEKNRMLAPIGFDTAPAVVVGEAVQAGKVLILVDPCQTNELYEAVAALVGSSIEVRFAPGNDATGYSVEQDNLLIQADKNPNRVGRARILGEGVEWDGKAPLSGYSLVLLIGRDRGGLPAGAVVLSAWQPVSDAVRGLPTTTWWETTGHCINSAEVERSIKKVLKAPGSAKDAVDWLNALEILQRRGAVA